MDDITLGSVVCRRQANYYKWSTVENNITVSCNLCKTLIGVQMALSTYSSIQRHNSSTSWISSIMNTCLTLFCCTQATFLHSSFFVGRCSLV